MKKLLRSNEQGMAHLMLGVLVVIVLAAVGLVGWKVMSNKNSDKTPTVSNSTSASKTTSTVSTGAVYSTCLAKYHDANVCHFAEAEAASPVDKTAYKATFTSTQSGSTGTFTYEQDGKGNNSLTTSGGGTSLNSITYAGVLYVENGSTWIKYPSSTAPQTTDPSSNLSFMGSLDSTTFTKVDSEACGSLTCLKYQISVSTSPKATAYVWFDTQDYLLREYSSSDPSSGTVDMKLSYQPVSISMPSPVESLSTTP